MKNPDKDRFQKEEPKNNLLSIEDFTKTLNPIIKRVRNVEKVGNQLLSDLHYGEEDFIGNYKPSKIIELPEDDIDETNNKYYDIYDDNGIITDNQDNNYVNEGNSNPYQEIDVNNTPIRKSHNENMNNTPKLFNINNKADENFVSPQPDLLIPKIIPEKENNITPQKETIKSTQKEKIKSSQKEIETYVIPEIIPEITDKYIIEPTDAIPINYEKARIRFKNLLIQFYPNYNAYDETNKKLINKFQTPSWWSTHKSEVLFIMVVLSCIILFYIMLTYGPAAASSVRGTATTAAKNSGGIVSSVANAINPSAPPL